MLTLGALIPTVDAAAAHGGVEEGDAGPVGNHWGQGGQGGQGGKVRQVRQL